MLEVSRAIHAEPLIGLYTLPFVRLSTLLFALCTLSDGCRRCLLPYYVFATLQLHKIAILTHIWHVCEHICTCLHTCT